MLDYNSWQEAQANLTFLDIKIIKQLKMYMS